MQCVKCLKDITSTQESIKCQECNNPYHLSCCNQTPGVSTRQGGKKSGPWRCEKCTAAGEQKDSVLELLKQIKKEMAEDRKENGIRFNSVNSNLTGIKDSLNNVEQKLAVIENDNSFLKTECAALRQENEKLSDYALSLECRISELEQYSRNHNLEIKGIPLTPNENVMEIMKCIAVALGITFAADQISACHRLPAPRDRRYHPAIIAQFVSRATRSTWLAAARQKKISTTDLSASLAPGQVFIFEHLTVSNKMVLSHGKALVRSQKLAYAWAKDGRIFARKTSSSPAVRVWTKGDIDRLADTSKDAAPPSQQPPTAS
jgi:hypothetical protein